jgi:hypothetical protein
MKTCGSVLHINTSWKWVVSFTARSLYSRTRWIGERVGPRDRSGQSGESRNILPLPILELRPLGRSARSQTVLSRLPRNVEVMNKIRDYYDSACVHQWILTVTANDRASSFNRYYFWLVFGICPVRISVWALTILRIVVVFVCPWKKTLGWCLNWSQDSFLLTPTEFIMSSDIGCRVAWKILTSVSIERDTSISREDTSILRWRVQVLPINNGKFRLDSRVSLPKALRFRIYSSILINVPIILKLTFYTTDRREGGYNLSVRKNSPNLISS